MKLFVKITLLLVLISESTFIFAQQNVEERFLNTRFVAFQDFSLAEVFLLNSSFLKQTGTIASMVDNSQLERKLTVDQGNEPSVLNISTDLAEGNVLTWEMKIIDEKTAEWRNFSCDCGEELVIRIFSVKKEAYKKTFANITLDELGAVNVNYTENFKRDILENANFLLPYFKESFQTYTLAEDED